MSTGKSSAFAVHGSTKLSESLKNCKLPDSPTVAEYMAWVKRLILETDHLVYVSAVIKNRAPVDIRDVLTKKRLNQHLEDIKNAMGEDEEENEDKAFDPIMPRFSQSTVPPRFGFFSTNPAGKPPSPGPFSNLYARPRGQGGPFSISIPVITRRDDPHDDQNRTQNPDEELNESGEQEAAAAASTGGTDKYYTPHQTAGGSGRVLKKLTTSSVPYVLPYLDSVRTV